MDKKIKQVEAGDTISFRLPVNTPSEVLDHLTELKESKQFGKECSRVFVGAITDKIHHAKRIYLELPDELSFEKQQWLENKETQKIIGRWLMQLMTQQFVVAPIDLPFEQQGKGAGESLEMPEPVQNLFNGIMAGMDDD